MQKNRVMIIGAGLGGLVLAHGLSSRGLDVAVYERDSYPGERPQGYRIQLGEPGLAGLQHCLPPHLFELSLATAGSPPPRVTVRNRQLEMLSDPATSAQSRSAGATSPRSFNRATLREILLSGLGENVNYGAQLLSYRQEEDGTVTAEFADGRVATADLLVGADGVGSTVRKFLLPDAEVKDAGLRLIYGRIPLDAETSELLPAWVFESIFSVVTAGPGQPHVGIGPVQFDQRPDLAGLATNPPVRVTAVDDYLAFMVGAPADHPAMPSVGALRQLDYQSLYGVAEKLVDDNWHPEIRQLLALWEKESLLALRVSTAAPVPVWEPSRVTLIGDAIHAMSPVLAMGANTAIRDASELTRALSDAVASQGSLVGAISGYQNRMAEYASVLVADSRRTGQARVGQA
ncbi:NAD(P)/FAD-dependent oxidoreductase [Rhodococcus sp. IEGM 1379]|uniref:FAD-dependent oxidoreductase n=1 Tax=Rhodococcus sp. IEGM 1379 TaxID=3047086 RepID=UPI0024B822D0|nr:NAD(P)/FAD-dependent oxidoreductase [Rhodococcus sp. IEGM 1379]MDI9915309.1 NAD(P)/FAD-dependent oxidoreductase [Rhodococcus sp. IEGM 1379]